MTLASVLLLLQTHVNAQDDDKDKSDKGDKKYEFVKTKSVNKSYNVSSSDKLNIENQFGKVEIRTWDRSEIKVDVSIEVSATKESVAQRIIDGISVSDNQSGREISFKTNMKGNNRDDNEKDVKSNMHINYSVSMPAGNPLRVSNQFGATTIPDMRGEVELTSKFGSLTTGTLSNIRSINVEFGKAKFESVANGTVTVKYSKADFDKLVGNIKLNLEFCGNTRVNMDNSLTVLEVKASYSSINLRPANDLSASYTIATSFGSLKNRTNIKFDGDEGDEEHGPHFDHKYTGRSGSGSIEVKVNTSFGSVVLGEPGPDDMKKEKNKDKHSRTS